MSNQDQCAAFKQAVGPATMPTMPEPSAYLYQCGEQIGVSLHYRGDMDLATGTTRHGLITTDQAEAYANARVREALEGQPAMPADAAMAAEYQRWIDAHHKGMDYDDFLAGELARRRIEGES